MNRKEAAELQSFIKAFGEGKDIEIRSKNPHAQLNGWVKMDEFIFGNFEYRIKPESKYRPFKDAKECWNEMGRHHPFGWLKNGNCYYNVVSISNMDANIISLSDVVATLCFSDFIKKNYIFADGVSFGVKEEEQLWKLMKKQMK